MWADPEAVFQSGLRIELVGWHLCRGEAVVNQEDIKFVLSLSTERARFAVECNHRAREAYFEQTGEDGISLPDPVAMCIASAGSGNTAPRCLAPPILGALLEIPCPPGDGIGL
jgi:purine nucleosidase